MSPSQGPTGAVFISFASEEQQVADELLASLEGGAIRCWIAHRDIPGGAAYPDAITSAIESCAALVVLVSDASNASRHVLREVELAFNASKPIVPVRLSSAIPSTKLQYFLSTTQWLDTGASFDQGDASQVRASLERMLAGDASRAGARAEGDQAIRRHWPFGPRWLSVIAFCSVVLLATLISYFLWWRTPEASSSSTAAGNTSTREPNPIVPSPSTTLPAGSPATGAATQGDDGSKTAPGRGFRTRTDAKDGQVYVFVPAGSFVMGCSQGDSNCDADEQPSHLVRFRRAFWIGRAEITIGQYRAGTGAGGARGADRSDLPVTGVTWNEAKRYCGLVGGRLPTEAEWEYAARAGVTTRYYGRPSEIAWFDENSDGRAHPVATREANAFGLYDMLGNVHEWVLDRYFNKYDDTEEATDPIEPVAPNASGVVRGGGFKTALQNLRLSRRLEREPFAGDPDIGFRCVKN